MSEIQYECGHTSKGIIVMDSNPLSISAYLEWKETVGDSKEQCFNCWCKNARRWKNE